SIGRFHLDGIPPAPRGIPQIEVTFDIDANGILHVAAKDKATGRSQQIRIEASSGLSQDEINKMKQEAQENADSDKKARETVDKLNAADALIFQTEKQLKEYGDKIPPALKGDLESALEKLKEAHKSKDLAAIDSAMANLNEKWQKASTEMYQNTQAGQQQTGPQDGPGAGGQKGNQGNDGEVTDVDFEEVK
ncbi:MAG TPA: Hsp70 family protein, partial [Bacteroidales bacterium]|nr:Hsp70 family protein [Bacteroidales bacterium]